MRKIVRNAAAFDGAIVVDPFSGTGTTGAACIAEGVSFVGVEKQEKWFKVAQSRLEKMETWARPADAPFTSQRQKEPENKGKQGNLWDN